MSLNEESGSVWYAEFVTDPCGVSQGEKFLWLSGVSPAKRPAVAPGASGTQAWPSGTSKLEAGCRDPIHFRDRYYVPAPPSEIPYLGVNK